LQELDLADDLVSDRVRKKSWEAKTTVGLKVTVAIWAGVYKTGKKCAVDFIANMRIVFDKHLPRWNYRALPQAS
jgi:hypothetical protein